MKEPAAPSDRLESAANVAAEVDGNQVDDAAAEAAANGDGGPVSSRTQMKARGRHQQAEAPYGNAADEDAEEDVPDEGELAMAQRRGSRLRHGSPAHEHDQMAPAALYDEGDDLADEPANERPATHSKGLYF